LGYVDVEKPVAGTVVDAQLSEGANYLNEVVITALGITREKKSLGYATQSVTGESLDGNTSTNLVNALAGKAAGVRITNTQGDMGSSRIVIRGETSIAGNNQPLFIVDGVPVDNSQLQPSSGAEQSHDFRNVIADIVPEDVASISVLKGPNAAALYGSRAAHGVVIITTKSGKGTKDMGITVNTGVSFSTVSTLPEWQNLFGQGSDHKFSYLDGLGGGVNDNDDESWGPRLDGRLIPQFFSNGVPVPWVAHPNNVRDFFKTGVTQDYGVSIANADDKYDFRLGINYQDQKGTVPNTEIKKTNLTLNANYQLSKRVKVGANINYIITNSPNLPGQSSDENHQRTAGVMLPFLWFGRQVDMAELNKDWNQSWNPSYYSNPYWRAYYNTVEQNRNRLIGDVHFSVNLLEGLDFRFRSGIDYYNDRRKHKTKPGTSGVPDGSYAEDAYTVSENNTEALFTFLRTFNDWSVDALGGFNVRTNSYANNWQKATKLAAPDLFTLSNSKDPLVSSNYFSRLRVYSVFAQVQVGYRNFVYLNLTGRNDWSSTLPQNNRSYFYPSATASLILSEWLGLRNNVLNFLKLRGSWAEVGSDADPYQLATVYGSQLAFDGQPIQTSSKQKNNPDIRPERTQSVELGLEAELLNNRMHVDVAFYNTNSIDQILKVQTSSASGYEYQLINAGKINNKGVEVQLDVTPLKVKNFTWNLGLNFAANRSVVLELDKEGLLERYVIGTPIRGAQVVAAVGERYGTIYGTAYKRDNNNNILVDDNGRPITDPNNKILGHYTPDWTGSFRTSFSYKGIELSVLFDGSFGGSIYSETERIGNYTGVLAETLTGRDAAHGGITFTDNNQVLRDDGMIFKGIRESDGKENTTILTAENYYKSSSRINEAYIYDASYVKLRDLRLSYTFDRDLIKKIGLSGLTVAIVAHNVAILFRNTPNFDPEVSIDTGNRQGLETLSLPSVRTFGFNVNLKF
jgi:TonB-linked SusC/RagA family outer membrane protein